MTVNEVYERGISHLPEVPNDNPDLKNYILNWVNEMLAETFHIENSIRKYFGTELLTEPQVVNSLDDEIEYNWRLVYTAFPYGIAAQAFIDDDNDYRSNKYGQQYVLRCNEAVINEPERIKDVY